MHSANCNRISVVPMSIETRYVANPGFSHFSRHQPESQFPQVANSALKGKRLVLI